MRGLVRLFGVLAVSVLAALLAEANVVKKGSAAVNIVFEGDTDRLPDVGATIYSATPFDENNMAQPYKFQGVGGGLAVDVPLLTMQSVAMIRIVKPNGTPYAVGLISLSQDKPLEITATYYAEKDSMGFKMSNADGMNKHSIGLDSLNKSLMIGQACMMICALDLTQEIIEESGLLSADDYSSWQKYDDKIEPVRKQEYKIAGVDEIDVPEAQPWLENSVRRYCICQWPMNFVRNAGYFGVKAENPPLEYYAFLDTLDVSEALLDYFPDLPPFYLLKQILLKVPGVEPIGEMDVVEWKQQSGSALSQVISQPLDFLLDMLAAGSYVIQLRDDNVPLTPAQKGNITAGLPEDLAAYLLEMNEMLERQLAAGANLFDLTDDAFFSLADFIKANYPGRPLAVDVWNTWCQPCLMAMQDTEALRLMPEFSDIVFLYISDDSSPLDQWQTLAPRIGGEQLRISQAARNAMFEQINSEPLFPTYLFFDSAHTLKQILVSFPGQEEYIKLLDAINRRG